MKKLISAILAATSIVCTTSSLAATSDGALTSASRNAVSIFETVETSTSSMPGFRGGDTISFDVSGLTNDNHLTVVSYKLGEDAELSNANIQYVNQYKIDAVTKTIEYTVRDNTEEGIYKLSLSGNDESEIVNFYYKVGNPTVSLVVDDSTKYWNITEYPSGNTTKYAVGFVAKAVLGSGDVTLADMGVSELGFTFTADGKTVTQKLTPEQINAITDAQMYAETDGGVAFVYGVTIYGIPSMDEVNAIEAEAYMNN